MKYLTPIVKKSLLDIKSYLENSDIKGAYEYLNEYFNIVADRYVSQITLALYDAGIDLLHYTDTVPDNFLFGDATLDQILNGFTIPNNIKFIGEFAFAHSSLKEIKIPESIFSIGRAAFLDTPISSIHLPKSIQMIDSSAFEGCYNLKTIYYAGTEEEFLDLLENSSGGDIYENSLKKIFGDDTVKKIDSGEIKIIYEEGFSKTW